MIPPLDKSPEIEETWIEKMIGRQKCFLQRLSSTILKRFRELEPNGPSPIWSNIQSLMETAIRNYEVSPMLSTVLAARNRRTL
jgi:hypothetical protein